MTVKTFLSSNYPTITEFDDVVSKYVDSQSQDAQNDVQVQFSFAASTCLVPDGNPGSSLNPRAGGQALALHLNQFVCAHVTTTLYADE